MESVLVFSRTKHGADKISHRLERKGITSIAIHSNRTQAQRQRALAGFKHGDFKVLVATDIAARGIDVEGITHVVNFDTPTFAEDYIHRIGRTGRATSKGDALTFVARNEQEYLRKIEYFVGKKFELKKYPGFDDTKRPAASAHTEEPSRGMQHKDNRRHFEKPRGTWDERQRRRERGDHTTEAKSPFQKPFRKRRPDNRGSHRTA
jgi:ATP-dependent RNA helicase RhlE